jgi:hypothetical protein
MTSTARLRPARRGGILPFLLLAPVLSGCETTDRMDFFDRFFEPASRPGPAFAMQPVVPPGDYGSTTAPIPAPIPAPETTLVRAMEPIPNPADHTATQDRTLQAASARTPEPRPNAAPLSEADAESRTRLLVRQNPWVTRFWMELTPEQRSRVERQLHRSNLRLAGGQAEPAAVWDPMGLADRVGLVFGKSPAVTRPDPMEKRLDSTVSDQS